MTPSFIFAGVALVLTAVTPAHALEFVFIEGSPAKVVLRKPLIFDKGKSVSLSAVLSDETGYTETIDVHEDTLDRDLRYSGTGYALDTKEIQVLNPKEARTIFRLLSTLLDQQKEQEKSHETESKKRKRALMSCLTANDDV